MRKATQILIYWRDESKQLTNSSGERTESIGFHPALQRKDLELLTSL
jgi:hypothetical protein